MSPRWKTVAACSHALPNVCMTCDFDRYYAKLYPDCPWSIPASDRSTCDECGEGIHLEYLDSDFGVLEGASMWEHDRWRSEMIDSHDPHPEWVH